MRLSAKGQGQRNTGSLGVFSLQSEQVKLYVRGTQGCYIIEFLLLAVKINRWLEVILQLDIRYIYIKYIYIQFTDYVGNGQVI